MPNDVIGRCSNQEWSRQNILKGEIDFVKLAGYQTRIEASKAALSVR